MRLCVVLSQFFSYIGSATFIACMHIYYVFNVYVLFVCSVFIRLIQIHIMQDSIRAHAYIYMHVYIHANMYMQSIQV